jgi:hypothetical protein
LKIAICQPTYLPWLGYFDLMDQVDGFVLLDSVQFEKQSWQHRNRIKTATGLQWLTVPVIYRGCFGQQIKQVEIRDPGFVRKHLRGIEMCYRRTRYFDAYYPELVQVLNSHSRRLLADLNIELLRWFCTVFGIQTPLLRSSTMSVAGRRSQLLTNLCLELKADRYLSPLGSAEYLLNDLELFVNAGIEVEFHRYEHPEYSQLFPPFCPYASALDLIFNAGPTSLEILRHGRRMGLLPAQVSALQQASA